MNQSKEARLTAYALGELGPSGRAEVEAWIAREPHLAAELATIRATVGLLQADLAHEARPGLTDTQRALIARGPTAEPQLPARRSKGPLLIGVALAAAATFALWPRPTPVEPVAGRPSVAFNEPPRVRAVAEADAPVAKVELPPRAPEAAPDASPRLSEKTLDAILLSPINSWYAGYPEQRVYVQVDKPLYRPGDTIWVKSWDVSARDRGGARAMPSLTYELVDPRGAAVVSLQVAAPGGRGQHEIDIPAGVPGGEYIVRASGGANEVGERKVIVASYQAPRIKKKLELLRKAYGPGDEVVAAISLDRATGEAFGGQQIEAVVRLDGEELPRVVAATNADGGALVRVRLPESISVGDALLTVLVRDGGVTESVSKRIPIPLAKMRLDFYPEGGDLVDGLPSRVYVAARDALGKPADFRGRIVDDQGAVVAEVESLKNGMGRFALVPAAGRRYFGEVLEPIGISQQSPLPSVQERGCVLRSFDDFDGQVAALRVAVRCHERQEIIVGAVQAERFLDAARIFAGPSSDTVLHLANADAALSRAQGVARVTVFDDQMRPLAERVVYRNRRSRMAIKVTPDRERYGPQDEVTLAIETRDAQGEPVAAELAMSVVDDTVVSHADDKQGHIFSKLLLEPELVGDIEEPNFYLDLTEADSGPGLDLLMGTQGYRRFDWSSALTAQRVAEVSTKKVEHRRVIMLEAINVEGDAEAKPAEGVDAAFVDDPMVAVAAPVDPMAGERLPEMQKPAVMLDDDLQPPKEPERDANIMPEPEIAELPMGAMGARVRADLGQANEMGRVQRVVAATPARVFPIPARRAASDDVRSDFRDTVLWAPTVTTDASGHGQVTFRLSDAVSSFRAFTEGIAGGEIGRAETVISSSLPFSMSVKVPQAVTSNDTIRLPLTLTNETDEARPVHVVADLGDGLLTSLDASLERDLELAPKSRQTIWFAARPGARAAVGKVRFSATSNGLSDTFVQDVNVQPVGFPATFVASGDLAAEAQQTVKVVGALAGSVAGTLTVYPSPVADMLAGLDGMLREPSGCFEQASSSNYPNVMVMNYLQQHEIDDPALVASTRGMLDRGYARLTGYETPERGYEWFGSAPGHEALSAYGLLQFRAMKAVMPEVDEHMIARTAEWLMSRRDGRGGFSRNPQALDSFGAASPEVTNAYITWSLVASQVVSVDRIGAEIATQKALAASTDDAYLLALATNTLLAVPAEREAGARAVERLVALQEADGAWRKADHSITRSGGLNLEIETTALASMALMQAGTHIGELDRAAAWIRGARGGSGTFGTTQATVLALDALARYENARKVTRGSGRITVEIDDKVVGELSYVEGRREPLVLAGLGDHLGEGTHRVVLRHDGSTPMPYTLDVGYRMVAPETSAGVVVGLETSVDRKDVKMGEPVRLTAIVSNVSERGQPMTLARVGIPGGLAPQTWQLQELRDRGIIGFYETTPQEVVLYFRDLAPGAIKTVPLDLVAVVPGTYASPQSQAYLYYTNELKAWAPGVQVTVSQ